MKNTKAIAVVGASESTLWSYWLMRNVREYGFPGAVWPVNPNRTTLYGLDCYPGVPELPGVPDVAVLLTNPKRSLAALAALLQLGTREIVVIADGFRETATAEGIENERQLVEIGQGTGATILGPNCVGFASMHDSVFAVAFPMPLDIAAGDVSLISHSGMLIHATMVSLRRDGVGIDLCYTIGNGALFTFEDGVRAATARATTRVVCGIAESIRDRAALAETIRAGRAAGTEYVFLLLGQSEGGARAAKSHTGAVIGDQRLLRAWLAEQGVLVVDTVEELARTTALLRTVGRLGPDRGVFFVTESGGGTGLAADTCARHGLTVATLAPGTQTALREHLLPGTTVGNPLDTTTSHGPDGARAVYNLIAADPAVGVIVQPHAMSWPDSSDERRWNRALTTALNTAATSHSVPLVYTSIMDQEPSDFMRELVSAGGVMVVKGLDVTVKALANLYRAPDGQAGTPHPTGRSAVDGSTVDESRAREILAGLGVPLIPGERVDSPAAAASAAGHLRAPYVAKVAVAGLAHKGRVGGVRLGLATPEAVAAACRDIGARVTAAGVAEAGDVGFLVQEMQFGPEILVGLVRDGIAGPAVVVGVGGWAAETSTLFGVIPLPATADTIGARLTGSSLPHLIGDDNVTPLAALIEQLGHHFTDGDLRGYAEVECNPVIVTSAGPRIADALLVQRR